MRYLCWQDSPETCEAVFISMKNLFARLDVSLLKEYTHSSAAQSIVLIPGVAFMAFYLEFLEVTGHKQGITIDLKDKLITNLISDFSKKKKKKLHFCNLILHNTEMLIFF